ncbi:unnamed protein product, partial [Meganyctiphanes norvegica]
MDTSLLVRHTFWSVQVLGMYFVVSALGISQPQFQRLVSVSSLRLSQGVMWAFLFGLMVLWCIFYFSGLVAYAAYKDCDPLTNGQIEKADQILVYMVSDKLSHIPGMSGLFVAAVAGAVLSSMSSQAAGLAAMIWEDFLKHFGIFRELSPSAACNVTRILSCLAGLLSIGMAFLIAQMGTLFQAAYTISGALVSPLDGLYITAIAAPWVNKWGALSGFLSAFVFNMCLVISKFYLKAGNSPILPLSTDSCPALVNATTSSLLLDYNSTLTDTTGFFTEDALDITTVQPTSETTLGDIVANERDYPMILDVSYCYLGTIGIIIVFVVSTIVSCITGVIPPQEADTRLVDRRCLAGYHWIWKICGGREKSSPSKDISTLNASGDLQNYGTDSHDNKALELHESRTMII